MKSHEIPNKSRSRALALLAVLTLAGIPPGTDAAPICGENSPAYPVPEYRGGTRLWPQGFRPARPGQPIPPNRDSTQFVGYPYPSASSGLELFIGLDIVDDRLIALYNVGLQVWNIGGAYAENPQILTYRDGLMGQWLMHPGDGEEDSALFDVAAMKDPSNPNRIFITTAGEEKSVGVAVWRYDKAQNALTPIYQDATKDATDVEMVTVGGRVYALLASTGGAFVVDVSATNELSAPCLDDEFAITCPAGIYLGRIGTADSSRYIGAIERNGSLFVGFSEGSISPNSRRPQIWQLDPSQPSNAVRRFFGSVRETHSPVFFRKGPRYYMAVVESKRLRIYDVSACLDADGCTSLPAPSYDAALRNNTWAQDFLTYSESNGTPFLYYGVGTGNLAGTAVERLLDLTNLDGSNVLTEITATGETYVDPCNGIGPIGYWADYYPKNDNGLRNFVPGKGRFRNEYFYRAATAVLDVHVRTAVTPAPVVTTTVTSPAPHFYGQPIEFQASAQNCNGPEDWTFLASDLDAVGLGVGDATASITWNFCPTFPCPDKNVEVWAIKDACAGNASLAVNRVTITLKDGRTDIFSDGFESGDLSAWN